MYIQRMREDFERVWLKNVVEVEVIIDNNTDSGNYFSEDDTVDKVTKTLQLNIQPMSSDSYSQGTQGLVTAGQRYKAYARYDADIDNDYKIRYDSKLFIIKNYNKSLYEGQCVFKEFDLVRI